jgi:hypothetical protein
VHEGTAAALQDDAMEQPFGVVGGEQRAEGEGALGLSDRGDLGGVAAAIWSRSPLLPEPR